MDKTPTVCPFKIRQIRHFLIGYEILHRPPSNSAADDLKARAVEIAVVAGGVPISPILSSPES